MFKRLSTVLRQKIGKQKYVNQQLKIVEVFEDYNQQIHKMFPNDTVTKAVVLKNKILTVKTDSSSRANELRFSENKFIKKINNQEERVKKIVYKY